MRTLVFAKADLRHSAPRKIMPAHLPLPHHNQALLRFAAASSPSCDPAIVRDQMLPTSTRAPKPWSSMFLEAPISRLSRRLRLSLAPSIESSILCAHTNEPSILRTQPTHSASACCKQFHPLQYIPYIKKHYTFNTTRASQKPHCLKISALAPH